MRAKTLLFLLATNLCIFLSVGCGGAPQPAPVTSAAASASQSVQVVLAPASPSLPATAAPAVPVTSPQPTRPPQLSATPASLSFPAILVGGSSTVTLEISNTGGDATTINSIVAGNSMFHIAAPALPFTLKKGYSISVPVSFAGSTAGTFQGMMAIAATGAQTLSVPVSGSVIANHQVQLSWFASPSVDGYYVYRGGQSGGPYARVTPAPVSSTNFRDTTVVGGQTYFYVVTAVAAGVESAYSTEVRAAIPSP